MKLFEKGHPFRRYVLVNLTLFCALALFLFLDTFSLFDYVLVCPLHVFGIYCPTCGITRASHALLRLDFAAAFTYHPLVFLLIALVIYYEAVFLSAALRGVALSVKRVKHWPFFAVVVCFLLFFLLRNILLFCGIDPVGDFLK